MLIFRRKNYICVLFVVSAKRRLTPTELLFEVPSLRVTYPKGQLITTIKESASHHAAHEQGELLADALDLAGPEQRRMQVDN